MSRQNLATRAVQPAPAPRLRLRGRIPYFTPLNWTLTLEQGGLPGDIRAYDLRHGMATQWLSEGINPKGVSERRLEHSNVGFTLQVYGHVLPHDEVQAAHEMENQLVSGPEKSSTFHQHEV
ncbi:MAG: hypothetical protein M1493_13845 [Firmicutes bacterium]|nr:hypothetical protein [Bacillota bacterium]